MKRSTQSDRGRPHRRLLAVPLVIGLAWAVTACDTAWFQLQHGPDAKLGGKLTLGNVAISEGYICGDYRINRVSGSGVVPSGEGQSTNFSVEIKLEVDAACTTYKYTGDVGLYWAYLPTKPECHWDQFSAMVPLTENVDGHTQYGLGGVATSPSCTNFGDPGTLAFSFTDDKFVPAP